MWRIAWILALWGLVGSPLPAPAQGAKDTLSVDLPGEPASLDPHVQWDTDSYHVYRNIFDNLVTRNPDGKIVPQIAKAWRYENDTTLVLDIRTDVKFHDGTPLTVDDVAWSVERIIDPDTYSGSPHRTGRTRSTPYPVGRRSQLLAVVTITSAVCQSRRRRMGRSLVFPHQRVLGQPWRCGCAEGCRGQLTHGCKS